MNLKRTATLVVVGGAVAVWWAAALPAVNRGVAIPPVDRVSPIDARGAALASEIARLHERLSPHASPTQPGRNLFTFTAVRPRPEPIVAKPALTEAMLQVPVATPPPPPFKLIGIAEDTGPEGPVRTAIVSAAGQVFLVREGQNVTLRFRVSKIAATVIELVDVGDGSTIRLALK
jgi:hypothetical protein